MRAMSTALKALITHGRGLIRICCRCINIVDLKKPVSSLFTLDGKLDQALYNYINKVINKHSYK